MGCRSRRSVLHFCAISGMGALSGCSELLESSPVQGTFIIENTDDVAHSVSVTATYLGDAADIEKSFTESVGAGQTVTKPEILNEHGTYGITVVLETGASARTEVTIVTHEGPGHYLRITITPNSSLKLTRKRSG